MNQEEGFFNSFDGTRLYYRVWNFRGPKSCFILHGYGEHCARYDEVAHLLSDTGFSFFAFDARGQGRSEGKRVHADRFHDYVKDVEFFKRFLTEQKKLRPDKPAALWGHSLGGLVAAYFAWEHSAELEALILTSPCFGLSGLASANLTRALVRGLNRVSPNLVLNNLVNPRYLFHGEEKMKEYLADPLIERKITVHLSVEIVKTCQDAGSHSWKIPVPVCVLASGDEKIVSLEATERWFERLQAPQKTMEVYPGFYHELFHEPMRSKPIGDLKRFLKQMAS